MLHKITDVGRMAALCSTAPHPAAKDVAAGIPAQLSAPARQDAQPKGGVQQSPGLHAAKKLRSAYGIAPIYAFPAHTQQHLDLEQATDQQHCMMGIENDMFNDQEGFGVANSHEELIEDTSRGMHATISHDDLLPYMAASVKDLDDTQWLAAYGHYAGMLQQLASTRLDRAHDRARELQMKIRELQVSSFEHVGVHGLHAPGCVKFMNCEVLHAHMPANLSYTLELLT